MDIVGVGAANKTSSERSQTGQIEFTPYSYHRISSSCDPNMYSAARFSPPYSGGGTHGQANVVENNYEPMTQSCTDSNAQIVQNDSSRISASTVKMQEHCSFVSESSFKQFTNEERTTVEYEQTQQGVPPQTCEITNFQTTVALEHIEQGQGNGYIHQEQQQITTNAETLIEPPLSGHIILHRSPNGHIYQNYYINQYIEETEMIEFVQINDAVNGEAIYDQTTGADYVQMKTVELTPSVEYHYHPKMPNNGELMDHLSDAAFTHLEPAMIPEQNQEDLLTEGEPYNRVVNNYSIGSGGGGGGVGEGLHLHDRDQHRILLESTMSPLLAAVNDITQRDAEFQSYLNQASLRENILETGYVNSTTGAKGGFQVTTGDATEQNAENDGYTLVIDKPVESRARASLPTKYLHLGISKSDGTTTVYSKKEIPLRTKFGPLEGEIRIVTEEMIDVMRIQIERIYPLLLLENTKILDVTNESTSNWMRFIKLASSCIEQNLLLFEECGKLYFKCSRVINPKEELRVGYSEEYAEKFNLRILIPNEGETQELFERDNPWICYECDERFPTSNEMQNHLSIHEDEEDMERVRKKRIKSRKKKTAIKLMIDVRKNSSRCCYCLKVFMTSVSLKKHVAQHLTSKKRPIKNSVSKNLGNELSSQFKCSVCHKKFGSSEKLKEHRAFHNKNGTKSLACCQCDEEFSSARALSAHVKSHAVRYFKCVFCQESFKHLANFKEHVIIHAENGIYTCYFCKKKYREYNLVRKHIKIFHCAVKHTCNECGRQFINLNFLRRHKVCHSDKRDFLCSECGKQFKRKDKLREHVLRMHTGKNSQTSKKEHHRDDPTDRNISGYFGTDYNGNKSPKPKDSSSDYEQFLYKCNECTIGFKRRGMLVNHMAKRHPNVHIDSIPELNLPIIKPQTLFYCQYCSKVYKSNGKRKVHILKNHPGQELPPPVRGQPELSKINVKNVGNVKIEPQRCHLCYKQYATRNKMVLHYRKVHSGCDPTERREQEFVPNESFEAYQPPISPENKLLKLSSAALELSSVEDRKFFDFLNERSQDHNTISTTGSLDDNANVFSKVDVNFKVVDGEFTETSSSTELNRLPQLFEESIACI